MLWVILSTVGAAMMATAMIFVRLRAARSPINERKIILPPLFMSTGAGMFLFPVFQLGWPKVLEAFAVGVVFSVFLIRSSKFEVRDDSIYLVPSRSFIFILIGLLLFRILLKIIIGQTVSFGETSGMFFLLAFGMILTWRIAMLIKYKKLQKSINRTTTA
ncbi:cytochrome c biogenesis protein CcdC [Aquibacillus sp. 3ASR75-11]|uniref:Cytochrome c biogenesis protein CcdC n=1 Tax=Terrihalobacillus insolitus TaxID=2950438 RepID=A0A9X3WUH7_9BACI|nr:cytochrome c biogenesis protein CcdC [Terrihalobacillus insolitus]MDC3425930.1 cytochrome c biogenesis protein CcdC [Terrihalobacillus insolitus]